MNKNILTILALSLSATYLEGIPNTDWDSDSDERTVPAGPLNAPKRLTRAERAQQVQDGIRPPEEPRGVLRPVNLERRILEAILEEEEEILPKD